VIRIGITIVLAAAPASAQTVTCATNLQGYRVCQAPDDYRSTERSRDRWMGRDTTAVWRRPEPGDVR
jgi:hypothetical protein